MRLTIIALLSMAPAMSAQTLAATPVVTIGGAMANTNDELVKVTGARRLPDGRIVVAIGDPIEVRVYDHAGTFINRFGRKGGGPGEFRAPVSIRYADNDSIVTYTDGYNRFAIFAPSGRLIREYKEEAAPAPPALLHRALLRSPGGIVNGCARAVMMALPLVTPARLDEVFPDHSGHFWAHPLQDRTWRVYSQAAAFLGTITLPPGATVLDAGTGYLLAHQHDADDVEEVIEYRVNVPAGPARPPCATRRDTFSLVSADHGRAAEFKPVFREAMTANEVVFSNVAHYPGTADSLQLKLPAGTALGVIEASRTGYADVVLDTRSSLACVMRIGSGSFPWPEGVIFCGN